MQVAELWAKLGLDKSEYDKGLDKAEGQGRNFLGALGGMAKQAVAVAGGMALWNGIQVGLRNAAVATLDFNAQLEQAGIAFETMLGSAEAAGSFLDSLKQFAAETPFEFPELVDASKRMLAFGFSAADVLPMMRAVGDAASGLGIGSEGINRITMALGQMKAKAKVSAEEMMQLTEAGVPAWDILAIAMGKSTAEVMKLSEQGLIPAGQAIDALVAGMEQKFPGMMNKQSKTFLGLLSTLKDEVRNALQEMTTAPFERLKQVTADTLDQLRAALEGFKADGLKGVIAAILPTDLAVPLIKFVNDLQPSMDNLRAIWEGLKPVAADLWGAIKDAFALIGPLVPPLLDGLTGLTRLIVDNWPALKPIVIGVVGGFLGLKGLQGVTGIINNAATGLLDMTAVLEKGVNAAKDAPAAWDLLKSTFNGLTGSAIPKLAAAFTSLKTAVSITTSFLMANPIVLIIMGIIAVAVLLYEAWTHNWGGIREKTAAAFAWLKGAFNSFIQFVKEWGPLVLAPLTGGLSLIGLLFTEKGRELLKSAMEWGSNIVQGLWNGLKSLTGWLVSKVSAWINEVIPEPIKKLLIVRSPSRLMDEIGQNVGAGLGQGMQRSTPVVVAAAQGLAKAVSDVFDYTMKHLDSAWQLYTLTTTAAENSTEYLQARLANLQQQLGLVGQELTKTQAAYDASVAASGLYSEASMKLGEALDELKVKQAELRQQVNQTTKAMQQQGSVMRQGGTTYVNVGNAWVDVNAIGTPQRDQAEVEAIARRQGVDLGTAEAMYDTNKWLEEQGKVPKYHSGGIYKAPPGMSEGLALLRDKELVLTPDQQKALGGGVSVYFAPGSVVIPAKDLAEMRTVQEFFARLTQSKRSILGTA